MKNARPHSSSPHRTSSVVPIPAVRASLRRPASRATRAETRAHRRRNLPYRRNPRPPPAATPAPCLADTVWNHQNVNGHAAPGAARAYIRDIALRRSDVHSWNETGWKAGRADHLAKTLAGAGHRLYSAAPTTRGHKGSGTAVLLRATVPRHPAEGILFARPDGKAMAVAQPLAIARQPIVYLVAHLPHDDGARETFLRELATALSPALAAQTAKIDSAGTAIGTPWSHPIFIWGGDMNFTTQPNLDDEKTDHPSPSPGLVAALGELNALMGGALDAYRAIHPHGTASARARLCCLSLSFSLALSLSLALHLSLCSVSSSRHVL